MLNTHVAVTGPEVSGLHRVDHAEELVGVAFFDDALVVGGEDGQAVVEHREGDAGRHAPLELLEPVTGGGERDGRIVGVAHQVLARRPHQVERHRRRSALDDDVLEGEGFAAAVGVGGEGEGEFVAGADQGGGDGLEVVGQHGAVGHQRVVEGEARAAFEGVGLAGRFVGGDRERRRGWAAVDRVLEVEDVGGFEVAHGAHVDGQSEIGTHRDVEHPRRGHRPRGVGVHRVDHAEELVGVAFFDDALVVGGEDGQAVVEHREGDAGRHAPLELLEPVTRGGERDGRIVGVAHQVLARRPHQVERHRRRSRTRARSGECSWAGDGHQGCDQRHRECCYQGLSCGLHHFVLLFWGAPNGT